jgi:hypothetical protein
MADEKQTPPKGVDWQATAQRAFDWAIFGAIVGAGIHVLATLVEQEKSEVDPEPVATDPFVDAELEAEEELDVERLEAAKVLGVSVDATADEIRAALRARMAETRAHPDQGGDGEEAKRLIAAKNLLIQRQVEVKA